MKKKRRKKRKKCPRVDSKLNLQKFLLPKEISDLILGVTILINRVIIVKGSIGRSGLKMYSKL